MKSRNKFLLIILLSGVVAAMFSGCKKEQFDESLLYGYWQSGSVTYHFYDDGNGCTWDQADDVNENDIVRDKNGWFHWTLDNEVLTLKHCTDMTGETLVPKVYKLLILNEKTLAFEDDYKNKTQFDRVY